MSLLVVLIKGVSLELKDLLSQIRILDLYALELSLEVLQLRVFNVEFKLILLDQELVGLENARVLEKFSLLQDALFLLLIERLILIHSLEVELLRCILVLKGRGVQLIVSCQLLFKLLNYISINER